MKSKKLRNLTAMLSLGALLASCSSDDVLSESQKPLEKDTDFYVNVKIATPSEQSTRATDPNLVSGNYVDGETYEQTIKKILFVFYNSDKQYVGNATYEPTSEEHNPQVTPGTDGAPGTIIEGSIETILNITVPVTIAKGSTKPAYVMAYVNPTNKATTDLFNNYNKALGAFRKLEDLLPATYGGNNTNGFTMNNSVYYEAKANDELPTIAVKLEEGKGLYYTEEEAKESTAPAVKIYVERTVAKVNLKKDDSGWIEKNTSVKDDASVEYTLKFDAKGWGLSNLEQRTFLVKNFRTEESGNPLSFDGLMTFNNFTYKTLNDRLNDENDDNKSMKDPSWNFPDNSTSTAGGNWQISGHRTFWALSPTYYHSDSNGTSLVKIPTYADEIYDGSKVDQSKASLVYRSFNDIYNTSEGSIGKYGKGIGVSQYTMEHTMQESMVTDYQKRAVTCAVVVGQYKAVKSDGTEITFTGKDQNFYIRKFVDTDGSISSRIYISDAEMKKAYLAKNSVLYEKAKNDDGTDKTDESGKQVFVEVRATAANMEDFEIYHPRIEDAAGSRVPSRFVTIKLKKEKMAGYYRQTTTGLFEEVSEDNINAVNKSLYQKIQSILGGIEMYKNGYAYYEIPVKHLWGRSNKSIGEKDFDAQLGQYGIVRNHVYNINVTAIDGIGTGISDPDAPIIPNVENDKYQVKTEILVQRWRVVPQQDVTLKP